MASDDNGPGQRRGILLFSRAEIDTNARSKLPSYIARWAVVLAYDAHSPDPVFGIGRMDVRRESNTIATLKRKITAARETGASTEEIQALEKELDNPENFSFPALLYHPDKLVVQRERGLDAFAQECASVIDALTYHGMTGGVLLRLRNGGSNTRAGQTRELFVGYSPDIQHYESGHELMARWLKNPAPAISSEDRVEAIPIQRIHNGWKGNKFYGGKGQFDGVCRTYFDRHGDPLVCRVVARVNYYADSDTTLLSRLLPLSPPISRAADIIAGADAGPEAAQYVTCAGVQPRPFVRNVSLFAGHATPWAKPDAREAPAPDADSATEAPDSVSTDAQTPDDKTADEPQAPAEAPAPEPATAAHTVEDEEADAPAAPTDEAAPDKPDESAQSQAPKEEDDAPLTGMAAYFARKRKGEA